MISYNLQICKRAYASLYKYRYVVINSFMISADFMAGFYDFGAFKNTEIKINAFGMR